MHALWLQDKCSACPLTIQDPLHDFIPLPDAVHALWLQDPLHDFIIEIRCLHQMRFGSQHVLTLLVVEMVRGMQNVPVWRSCKNMSDHLSSSICDSSPKTYNTQIAIQFATRKLRFRSFPIPPISLQPTGCDSSRGCDSSPKTCIPQVAIQFATCTPQGCDSIRNLQVAIPVPKPASRRLRFNSQPASCDSSPKSLQPAGCDSLRGCDSSPKTCIPQVTIQFATCTPQGCDSIRNLQVAIAIPPIKPATHRLRFESKLRFQSQNLHPAGCDSIRNLQVAIPVPKPASHRSRFKFNSQPALRRFATHFATCKLRFQSQKPATCRLRFTSRLRFQSQNLHPAGCDSIRNLQVAMPIISDPSYIKACNPQVAIRVEVAIPVPKPASRRLRFNSQPASCDSSPKSLQPTQVAIHFEVVIPVPKPASRRLRFNSQPASCDSMPKTCIPQVAI